MDAEVAERLGAGDAGDVFDVVVEYGRQLGGLGVTTSANRSNEAAVRTR
jgi:hypothetical protein